MLSRQLEYLVALAQERHFAHAAERCNISQPALSLAIKQLETDLGVTIVERGNRFRGFTREGEIVLRWARKMLRDEETLLDELHSSAEKLEGRLRLGVIPTATAIAAMLTTGFARYHAGISITLVEMPSIDIVRALAAYELDAGITYVDNEPLERVRTIAIASEEYVLVTPADTVIAQSPTVSWAAAAGVPLCLLGRDMQNRRIIDGILERIGTSAYPRIETNSLMSNYCYLRAGWSSIMPRSYVDWIAPPPHMVALPLVEPTFSTTIGLVVADRTPLSLITGALWSHVERRAVD